MIVTLGLAIATLALGNSLLYMNKIKNKPHWNYNKNETEIKKNSRGNKETVKNTQTNGFNGNDDFRTNGFNGRNNFKTNGFNEFNGNNLNNGYNGNTGNNSFLQKNNGDSLNPTNFHLFMLRKPSNDFYLEKNLSYLNRRMEFINNRLSNIEKKLLNGHGNSNGCENNDGNIVNYELHRKLEKLNDFKRNAEIEIQALRDYLTERDGAFKKKMMKQDKELDSKIHSLVFNAKKGTRNN